MEQIIVNPLSVEIEHIGDNYMLSFSFKDKETLLMDTKFIAGNIFINDKIQIGFDAPETFETYFGLYIEQVSISIIEDRMYLDIYVKSD